MRKTTRKKLFRAALLMCLLACAACGRDVIYETKPVVRRDISSVCTATGTINPVKTVAVGTQVSGRIKALYADYNSPVQSGQLIAEIDQATFEAQLEQARANLLSAQANLKQAEATLQDAARQLRRSRQLHASRVVGQSELDAVTTKHAVAESQVGVARAQVVQAQASFDYAETNLQYTKIYCPVDGIVMSRKVDIGQTVAAAFQTPTLFTVAQDLTKMQINTNVDEADIGKVAVGQKAEFSVDAYPETTFAGSVVQIRNEPQIVQNVVTYDVVVEVSNGDLKLKPGMTANVVVIVATRTGVLCVPDAALRFKPEGAPAAEGSAVWVPGKKKPRRIEVTTGISDYSYSELLGGGLQPGQEVIVGRKREQ